MRVRFVSKGGMHAFKELEEGADVFLFGFNGMGEVSYEKELKGESDFFERVALLSKSTQSVVVCGCITDTRGHKRKSAVVAENGRLLGVSDMLHVLDGEWGSGANLSVYQTRKGKLGVLVAEDLYFPEAVHALALCGSECILCPFGAISSTLECVYARAYSHAYGTPIYLCADGYAMLAAQGEVVLASPVSPLTVAFEPRKEYHLIETRRKGSFHAGA